MAPQPDPDIAPRPVPAARSLAARFLQNGLLLAAVLALCLGFAEFAVRAFLGDRIVLFPRYQTAGHYGDVTLRRLLPNFAFWHTSPDGRWRFITNTKGFRADKDYAYEKPAGTLRVLVLGDFYTEGFEVRQSAMYSNVLEERLNRDGFTAEVLNTGMSGFGTAEELLYLENEGIKYRPDLVVIGFFANDFEDNVKSGLFKVADGKLVATNNRFVPGVKVLDVMNSFAPLRWLSEHSYFYSLAANTAWDLASQALLESSERQAGTEFATPTVPVSTYMGKLQVALLQRLADFCRSNKITLILLDIPQVPDLASVDKTFASSIPANLNADFRRNSDVLIASEEVLGPYRGLVDFHLLHGHRHISEFTHLMLGLALADGIEYLRAQP